MAAARSRLRDFLVYGASIASLGAAAWGVRAAMRAPMFLLQVVEIADKDDAPVDAQTVGELAALPVGHVNLFDVDLRAVERRILTQPWIREVRLQKHFPQTLSISVVFREPQALFQGEGGALSYVDADGKVFGQVSLSRQPDLPVIAAGAKDHVPEALRLIRSWDQSDASKTAQLSMIQWEAERGFRALVAYSLRPPAAPSARGRTFIDLGQDIDAASVPAQLQRISRVFQYLSANHVMASQVWADAGKKIVVRTARGS